AEARFIELEQLHANIRVVEQALQLHAPAGVAQLIQQREQLQATLSAAQTALTQLPPQHTDTVAVAQADHQLEAANNALREISEELNAAQLMVSRHRADRDSAQRELDTLITELQKPERKQRERALQEQLVLLQAEQVQRERLID